MNTKKWY